jgi:circadian clock protein KaiC
VPSGNAGLDRLTHGGLLRGSSTLLSGPTGTGKTLLTTQFAAEGAASGEPALVVAYEETPEQVRANGWLLGHDFAAYEERGLLHIARCTRRSPRSTTTWSRSGPSSSGCSRRGW